MSRNHSNFVHITPQALAESRARLAEFNRLYPPGPMTPADAARALAHNGPEDYFATTHLYWECECAVDYFRPSTEKECHKCGQTAEDSADARIHELQAAGIRLDYGDPAVLATLDEYNLRNKAKIPAVA